jgi:hypothetical protein
MKKRLSQQKLTPRQWALYRLIRENSLVNLRKTSQIEICEKLSEFGYVYNKENSHDGCSPIWSDISAINQSAEIEKLIISENFEYWIGDKEETQAYIDTLWKRISPKLHRYWLYLSKSKRDGLQKLFTENGELVELTSAREFVESFNPNKVSGDEYE